MSKFDQKAFEFLTKPDNWDIAKDIYDKMTFIREQLVKEFWNAVMAEVKKKIDLSQWVPYEKDDVVGIEHSSWKTSFSVEFGRMYSDVWLGIWCDSASPKLQAKYKEIAIQLKSVEKKLTKTDATSYPAWFYLGDNFSQWTTLDKLLPSNRTKMVESYSSMLITIKDVVKPVIDSVIATI